MFRLRFTVAWDAAVEMNRMGRLRIDSEKSLPEFQIIGSERLGKKKNSFNPYNFARSGEVVRN